MPTYYVGIGGNDANDGLTWETRFLTLNAAEDVPVVAGDTVIVGAGTYREMLTVDVSGSAGNPITYIADVTGYLTDGIGGRVRVTGSDNDETATRTECVVANNKQYRTFRGFLFDMASDDCIEATNDASNWIVEDCVFGHFDGSNYIDWRGTTSDAIIRRCIFFGHVGDKIIIDHSVVHNNSNILVENCLFLPGVGTSAVGDCVEIDRVGGVTVKNCTAIGTRRLLRVSTALDVGQTCEAYNNIIVFHGNSFQATVVGEVIEDYNLVYPSGGYTNVSVGANTINVSPKLLFPILLSGFKMMLGNAWFMGILAQESAVLKSTGSSISTDDIFGITRPAHAGKKSWGAVETPPQDPNETGTVDVGDYSYALEDAGVLQFVVPVRPSVQTTISTRVYRETNYSAAAGGHNPRLTIKQAGQADASVNDGGAVDQWNGLSISFTPDSSTSWVIVELSSGNTGTIPLGWATYWDEVLVT